MNIYDWDYQREAVPSYKWRVVSDEPTDPSTERREAELSVLRREVDRLLADSESLRAMLVEQQRLLDATEADLARYRAMWEQSRPHQPERVAGVEQQLVLAGLLEALATSLRQPTTTRPRMRLLTPRPPTLPAPRHPPTIA